MVLFVKENYRFTNTKMRWEDNNEYQVKFQWPNIQRGETSYSKILNNK